MSASNPGGPRRAQAAASRARATFPLALTGVAAAVVLTAHLLGTPRNAGPDEASHQVTSAALVRGERTGTPVATSRTAVTFVVPGMAGTPTAKCFKFRPNIPVSCNNDVELTTTARPMATSSQHYPPLGLVLPGLASFVPWAAGYGYLARALAALIPFLFLVAAIRRTDGQDSLVRIGLLAGLTPIVWSTMSITNPSGLAIAGGLGLWVAMLLPKPAETHGGDWLLVAGWAAIAATRRDGPLWATLILLAAAVTTAVPLADLWDRLPRPQKVIVVGSWLATVSFVRVDTGSPFPFALALSPLALPLAHRCTPWVRARARAGRRGQMTLAGLAASLGGVVVVAVVALSDGITKSYLYTVVAATGEHLVQIVGRLGYLDATAPMSSVLLWWLGAGLLLGVAAAASARRSAIVIGLLALVIVLAWVLAIGSGNRSGSYWQARYSMPLIIGLPLCLARAPRPGGDDGIRHVVVPFLGATTWWVWNATFFAAERRWSVGVRGPLSPLRWDTWGSPLSPAVLVACHAAASAVLVAWALRPGVPTRTTA